MSVTDNISSNSIKRLALKASVGSLTSDVPDVIRKEISSICMEICHKTKSLCEMRNAKTITHGDVEGAINSIHYLQDMKLGQKPRNIKSCPNVANKTFGMRNNDRIIEKRILKSKKAFNCFNIPKIIFKKLMDECISDDKRKSNNALILFQDATENHIINIFKHAQQMNENKTMKDTTVITAIKMIKEQHGKTEETHKEKFDVYIKKILKQVHPDAGITKDALFQTNTILNLTANKIASESLRLCRVDKKSTVSAKHVSQAVRLVLTSELAKHSISDIYKAITKASSVGKITTDRRLAGLTFSPTRVGRFMSDHSGRTGVNAKIAITAVIEYLSEELLELGGNVTKSDNKINMTERHLFLAIADDEELFKFINNILGYKIPLSGVNIM